MMTATPSTLMTKRKGSKWDAVGTSDVEILSSYGTVVVVIWGMTEQQEKCFLSSL